MSVFKCKMCGGTINFNPGDTVGVCEYCGSKQTLPRLDNDKKASMYDRANHFRRTNDFDKATNIYEQILNEDKTDAEAYWSLVLCRYGIEYVEDPSTHKRVPTVNRVQFTSIFNDDDYKSALEYADEYQREIYKEEAKTIDDIQKGILAISSKEEPFDIFICYKETDSQGRRTIDSVLAYDIYNKLTKEGYKVFFSRVTLEDKLGTAYEPYIFAALNSAKIMIAIGTKPEYFNAVWVKNEWSRYLALIKNGADKTLIPAYRDMDPYDLPEEFSYLQALDMSKLGFMQDLIRGVGKIIAIKDNQVKEYKKSISTNTEIEPLLKRGFMFLEDGNWNSANEYFERVLDIDPENGYAYLGKLMVDLKANKLDYLADLEHSFKNNINYAKTIRFADESLCEKINDYLNTINNRNKERLYQSSLKMMKDSSNVDDLKKMAINFESLGEYEESKKLVLECNKKIEEIHKKAKLISIKRKKIAIFVMLVTCACVVSIFLLNYFLTLNNKYNNAIDLMNNSDYIDAYETLIELNGYKDSDEKASSIYELYKKEKIKNASVGDYILFGSYEQDNDLENGKEDIEWLVLDIKDGKALLISKYGLDCIPDYSEEEYVGAWRAKTIRTWLNNDFFNNTFSNSEKSIIFTVNVTSDLSFTDDIDGRIITRDNIFLLSIYEAKKFFKSDFERKCKPTAYAIKNGAYVKKDSGNCYWWLRSFRENDWHTPYVLDDGSILENGSSGLVQNVVRPALWVKLNS